MKNLILKTKVLLLIMGLFAFVSSCSKDDNNNKPNTIAQIVIDDAELSTLETAVIKANLSATLSGAGPYSLFAPTNAGFDNAGITAATIDALSVTDLSNLLLYHVIPLELFSSALPAGPNAKVIAANGDSVFVTVNSTGVFVNGAQVSQADIDATNGVVHKINNVLVPASGNIVETAMTDTALSLLVIAVVHASTGTVNVADILTSADIHSVFAPTNNAFRSIGLSTEAQIKTIPPDNLAYILAYHVLTGRIFSSNLTDGDKPLTLNGQTVTVSTTSGVTVKGNTNATAAKVIKANVMATNGVIHIIDQVLSP